MTSGQNIQRRKAPLGGWIRQIQGLLGWHLGSEMWTTFTTMHSLGRLAYVLCKYSLNSHRPQPTLSPAHPPNPTLQTAALIHRTSTCGIHSLAVGLSCWSVQNQIAVQWLSFRLNTQETGQRYQWKYFINDTVANFEFYGYQFRGTALWLDFSHQSFPLYDLPIETQREGSQKNNLLGISKFSSLHFVTKLKN